MNRTLKAIIVDDERKNREVLLNLVQAYCPTVSIVDMVSTIKEATVSIKNKQPDIVFLDVEMPAGNGFDLLEEFDDPPFEVIFTTAFHTYALKAIKFAALDYLLKPISVDELIGAVNKAAEKRLSQHGHDERIDVFKSNVSKSVQKFTRIALPTMEGIDFIEIEQIIRCEANRSYSNFHLKEGSVILVSKSLSEFENLLSESDFLRIHRSHMVNLHHVAKYFKGKGGYVEMSDGSHVDVSSKKKDQLLELMANI